jgi:hypothetical protein
LRLFGLPARRTRAVDGFLLAECRIAILHFNFGNRPDAYVREQMHRFTEDIAPAFGRASSKTAAAAE